MLQNISNLLIFDIDEEQEIYNDNNMNFSDTYFPQFFIQSLYNFNNEFGDTHQLNGDVIYSKKLRDLDDKFRNDHYQHRGVTTQDDIELPDIDLKETEEAEELELKVRGSLLDFLKNGRPYARSLSWCQHSTPNLKKVLSTKDIPVMQSQRRRMISPHLKLLIQVIG
ncbi:unnamed protein product [Rhizophagus irregularis]|nr:unnamed protein product [Rhizophagus irregularis]CAB5377106.1 unnamed protein product [Rhizophagus irregularis]